MIGAEILRKDKRKRESQYQLARYEIVHKLKNRDISYHEAREQLKALDVQYLKPKQSELTL